MDNEQIILKLTGLVSGIGYIAVSVKTKVSPSHLYNLVKHPEVFRLTNKIRQKLLASGLFV